ncbi:hypothetical protein R6Q57_008284 [Mikania cordata]
MAYGYFDVWMERGKHSCVDLTGVSPLVGLRDNRFVAGHAALKAESGKVAKHKKACLANQHDWFCNSEGVAAQLVHRLPASLF